MERTAAHAVLEWRTGPSSKELGGEVFTIRQLLRAGDLAGAGPRVDALMDACGGVPRAEALLVCAEYLLRRGRPFSAEVVLGPLLADPSGPRRARLLSAEAALRLGDPARARAVLGDSAEQYRDEEHSGPIDIERLAALSPRAATARHSESGVDHEAWARALPALTSAPLFTLEGLLAFDESEDAGQLVTTHSDSAAYLIGETVCRLFGGQWLPRAAGPASAVTVPLSKTDSLELSPSAWCRWRGERDKHRLRDLIAALMCLRGSSDEEVRSTLGIAPPGAGLPEELAPHDPLSEALHTAVASARIGSPVLALGVTSDSPFSRVEVPLVLGGEPGFHCVLFAPPRDPEGTFSRYLDLLALGPFGAWHWTIVSADGNPAPAFLAYEPGDPAVRAGLVARRLCSEDTARNARWAVYIARALLGANLDGSLTSIAEVDEIIREKVRPGGPERWGELHDDRSALLFLATCYVGEVLRAHVGGAWTHDRITGDAIGPTSGLESGDMTFNLGATVLKRFFEGDGESLLSTARTYRERVSADTTTIK